MRTIVFVVFTHMLKIIKSHRLPMLADCTEFDTVGHGNKIIQYCIEKVLGKPCPL